MRTVRGFTLVETTVAALIVAVGVLAILGAERNSRRLGDDGARYQRAVDAAASRLDSLRAACRRGWPAALTPVSVLAPPGGPVPVRPVRVETLLACGPPP